MSKIIELMKAKYDREKEFADFLFSKGFKGGSDDDLHDYVLIADVPVPVSYLLSGLDGLENSGWKSVAVSSQCLVFEYLVRGLGLVALLKEFNEKCVNHETEQVYWVHYESESVGIAPSWEVFSDMQSRELVEPISKARYKQLLSEGYSK